MLFISCSSKLQWLIIQNNENDFKKSDICLESNLIKFWIPSSPKQLIIVLFPFSLFWAYYDRYRYLLFPALRQEGLPPDYLARIMLFQEGNVIFNVIYTSKVGMYLNEKFCLFISLKQKKNSVLHHFILNKTKCELAIFTH